MADENIRLNVVVDGEEQLKQLSSSLKNLALSMSNSARLAKNMDAQQRGLNKALGNAGRGAVAHAKNIRGLVTNQAALSQEIRKVNRDLQNLQKRLSSGKINAREFNVLNKSLRQTGSALRGIKARAFISDLRGISVELKRLGKDAQFVGRSLIIGLTTPLLLFANRGLAAFVDYNRELVRFQKIAGDIVTDLGDFEDKIYDLSDTFGIAKSLLMGVSADFAELGLASTDAIEGLTRLTTEMSVLGSIDISESQELTQTMFLGMIRTMDLMGRVFPDAAAKQEAALAAVNAQMVIFNAIENNTAMSFRDLATAIPEAAAAGTAFGLTMTQMASLLAPMKAAGIDIGVAATGMKVSLQRMASPTIKVQKLMKSLGDQYGTTTNGLVEAFENIKGLGTSSLQGLIDATAALREEVSDETVFTFFSQLFETRQGPRMLVAVDSMVQFQKELNSVRVAMPGMQGNVMDVFNTIIDRVNKASAGTVDAITNFETFTDIAKAANASIEEIRAGEITFASGRMVSEADKEAAITVRREIQKFVQEYKDIAGIDLIDQITSQAGKGFLVELLGADNAQQLAQQELNVALNSTAVAVDRMRNSFKNMAADLISQVAPVIEKVSRAVSDFARAFREMPASVKNTIIAVAGLVAAIGPLVFVFGQLKLASGVVLESLLKFIPGLKNLTTESVASASKLMFLRNGLTRTGDTIVNTNSRFATLLATLASGDGIIARFANRMGLMTGTLSKTRTAAADVVSMVDELKDSTADAIQTTFGGAELSQSTRRTSRLTTGGLRGRTGAIAGFSQMGTAQVQSTARAAAATTSAATRSTANQVASGFAQQLNAAVTTTANATAQAAATAAGGVTGQTGRGARSGFAQQFNARPLRGSGRAGGFASQLNAPIAPTPSLIPSRRFDDSGAAIYTRFYDKAIELTKQKQAQLFGVTMDEMRRYQVREVNGMMRLFDERGRLRSNAERDMFLRQERKIKARYNALINNANANILRAARAHALAQGQAQQEANQRWQATQERYSRERQERTDRINRERASRAQVDARREYQHQERRRRVQASANQRAEQSARQQAVRERQERVAELRRRANIRRMQLAQEQTFEQNRRRAARVNYQNQQRAERVARNARLATLKERQDFNKKVGILEKKGVTATSKLRTIPGLNRKELVKSFEFRGREISEAQADAIGRGGLAGARTRMELARGRARERITGGAQALRTGAMKPVKAVGSAAVAPFKAARKAIADATAASLMFGGTAPGAFSKAGLAVKGFSGSILRGIKVMKLFKLALISTGVGAIFVGLGVVVMMVMKNIDNLRSKSSSAFSRIGKAVKVVKDALFSIIEPILDVMATLAGAGDSGQSAMGGIMDGIATAIEAVATGFKWLVDNIIRPVVEIFSQYIFAVIKLIIGIVKGVMKIFKGDFKGGMKVIGDAFVNFFKAILKVAAKALALMSDAFFNLAKFIINAIEFAIRGVVEIFYFLVEVVLVIGRKFFDIWSTIAQYIPDAIGAAIRVVGGFLADFVEMMAGTADKVSGFLSTITGGLIPETDFAGAGEEVRSFFDGIGNSVSNFANNLNTTVMSVFDIVGESILDSKNGVTDWIHSWSGGLDGVKKSVGDFFRGLAEGDTGIAEGSGRDFISSFFDSAEEEDPYRMMGELLEPTIENSEETGDDAGSAFADAFANALKDLRQQFVDLVGDYLTNEIKDASDMLVDALQKQRDAALKMFDDQLDVIDKLSKAEESLMREREFLANRRRILDERELNRQNYVRNRALAIYEGRIDDARMLDLQEQKSNQESAASLEQLQNERNQDLRKENLEFLRDQIKQAQKEADEFFKAQIDAFKESAQEITRFAPQTIEDYQNQLNQLTDLATQFAQQNGEQFATTFENMQQKIEEGMPNKALTPFAFQLDALVAVANEKYGLLDENVGIVGATLSMLQSIEDKVVANTGINAAFESLTAGLETASGDTSSLIQTAMSGMLTGWESLITNNTGISTSFDELLQGLEDDVIAVGLDDINAIIAEKDPAQTLLDAITFAETSIMHGWQGTVGHIMSAVEPLANMMNPMLANILEAQIAIEELASTSASAGQEIGNNLGGAVGGGGGGGGFGGGGGSGAGGAVDGGLPAASAAGYRRQADNWAADYASTIGGYAGQAMKQDISNAIYNYLSKMHFNRGTESERAAGRTSIFNAVHSGLSASIKSPFKAYVNERNQKLRYPERFQYGGMVRGFKSAGVPAILHGGEFVVNSKAVSNMGVAALQALNNMRFSTPRGYNGSQMPTTINKTENINIYVDTFIGEDKWFNEMMDQYNIKMRPINDKKRGGEVRVFDSYSYRAGR